MATQSFDFTTDALTLVDPRTDYVDADGDSEPEGERTSNLVAGVEEYRLAALLEALIHSIPKARLILAVVFWLVLICSATLANVQVTSTGGTSPVTYATLKEAFDAVNAGVHTGDIQARVQGNTVETASAVLNASGSGAASYTSISVFPEGGAARTITGNINGHLIDLNGADNVTINGTAGNDTLTISNTSTSALATTIRFVNFGNKSSASIKDFLAFAHSNWQVKPRLVMFAGDASFDARNYLGQGSGDMVPTRLVDTAFLETASDDWLADFDNDGIADVAVGRLPVRSADEAAAVVAKLIGYESSRAVESALLVSDQNDPFNFEQASEQLRPTLETEMRVERLQRGRVDPAETKAKLIDAISRGQKVINYIGHGSLNAWRGNLLTSVEARELSNEGLPLMVMMSCLNGYFHDSTFDSLAESLIKSERGGAVAAWASSGITFPQQQAVMNQQLYRLLFGTGDKGLRLGEAALKAKQAVGDPDIRRTWILLGDPSMRLR